LATSVQAPWSGIAPDPTPAERVLRVRAGGALRGAVTISGAKNAALPALAATLLTSDECVLSNVPDLADIGTMLALLRSLGV
jgi:UDP-N-acetylglucosamine 1-carboxyvinyltransferase